MRTREKTKKDTKKEVELAGVEPVTFFVANETLYQLNYNPEERCETVPVESDFRRVDDDVVVHELNRLFR